MSDSKEQEINTLTSDQDDESNNKTETLSLPEQEVEVEDFCNENIYNAFLIANYKDGIIWDKQTEFDTQYGLGVWAYFTAGLQFSSLIFLILVTKEIGEDEELGHFLSYRSVFFMWPMFMIACVMAYKENIQTTNDIAILKKMNIYPSTYLCSRKSFNVIFLKEICEHVIGFFGSIIYFVTLVYYSRVYSWDDILSIILNLLAFQFILEVDEWAYLMVKGGIRDRIQPPLSFHDFFKGKRNRTKLNWLGRWKFLATFFAIVAYSSIIQIIYYDKTLN